jgi:hypothetical protein
MRPSFVFIAGALVAHVAGVLAQTAVPPRVVPPITVSVPTDARLYVQLDPVRPGRMAAWREPDGTTRVVYQHANPGGCQTDLQSTIFVDVVGAPVWDRHTGQKCDPRVQINESYTRSGSIGIWKTHLGNGEEDVIGKKFYTSAADVPEERALLVRALLAAGNALQLMPAGDGRVERLKTLTLKAAGRSENVTQYRVHGLSTGPAFVWLDSQGELFAVGDNFIRQGWESVLPEVRNKTSLVATRAVATSRSDEDRSQPSRPIAR